MKCFIHEGTPVGWACYTSQGNITRKLVQYGVNAAKTSKVLFFNSPPLLVAAKNSQLESIKLILDKMGHVVRMVGPRGWNMVEGITTLSNWRDLPGHCDSLRWARERLD